MVQIGDHTITKAIFSSSLKPDGWLSSFVINAQCEIWRSQCPDKKILTTYASKELLESNISTKSLDAELTEKNVKEATKIFVPVNVEEVHWILVVMDFQEREVQILDSMKSDAYVAPAYQVAASLELYLMTKFKIATGFPKNRNLKLTEQANTCDCGLHVLLYIQRYGRSDMYGIDEEQILRYRKQLAYELKHESNDHPSTSTLHIDDSPIHSARSPSGISTKIPSVSGSSDATISDKENADEEDTSDSSLMPNAEQVDISAIVHVAYISGINIHQNIIDGSESSNQGQTGSNSTATRFQKVQTFGQHSTLNFPCLSQVGAAHSSFSWGCLYAD